MKISKVVILFRGHNYEEFWRIISLHFMYISTLNFPIFLFWLVEYRNVERKLTSNAINII